MVKLGNNDIFGVMWNLVRVRVCGDFCFKVSIDWNNEFKGIGK